MDEYITLDNDAYPNTIERIMDYSYYETHKLYKNYLPKIVFFDEFKTVKSDNGVL